MYEITSKTIFLMPSIPFPKLAGLGADIVMKCSLLGSLTMRRWLHAFSIVDSTLELSSEPCPVAIILDFLVLGEDNLVLPSVRWLKLPLPFPASYPFAL